MLSHNTVAKNGKNSVYGNRACVKRLKWRVNNKKDCLRFLNLFSNVFIENEQFGSKFRPYYSNLHLLKDNNFIAYIVVIKRKLVLLSIARFLAQSRNIFNARVSLL